MEGDEAPQVVISYPNGSYADCLRGYWAMQTWIMVKGIAGRSDIEGRLGTAYQGRHYDKRTVEDPTDSGWTAYAAFWTGNAWVETWLRSLPLPAGARFGPPDPA